MVALMVDLTVASMAVMLGLLVVMMADLLG